MPTSASESTDKVNLADIESKVGEAEELTAHDRARLSIAVKVLAALFIVFCGAGWGLLYGPDSRLEQAKEIFEFVKTIAPPIATLVLGFYFRSENG
jgi:hypothetical protein